MAVQFFDQLGRVRLAKTLEDAATQSATNETDGIKLQTRYMFTNSGGTGYTYQLTSNPYRASTSSAASSEPTMGWTRSKAVNTGKHSEVETFSGAALPAPWGTNTSSTGKVQTDIDANSTTVTDQAGKLRRSITNGLGQLVRVDEPNDAGQLGNVDMPNQPTFYAYDALNNLTSVNQGVQTRTFAYNSLSRLLSAANPESGTILYQYDPNGNLTRKTDARGVETDYVYDALNRVTNRNYSLTGSTPPNYQATPNVEYFYDNLPNAKGKLIKVTNGTGVDRSTTEYSAFDILGRVTAHKQTTDVNAYTSGYVYNLSGALIEETYPSGRVVKNTLDADGDLSQVESRKVNDVFRNNANSFNYTSAGAVSSMKLGNGRWENTQFNSRLQPVQIGLGSSATSQNLLKLNYDYGTTDNNGNVKSQVITLPTVGANQGFVATQDYTYDSLNRIKQATETIPGQTAWRQTFQYDRYGNRRFDTANTTTPPPDCAEAVCNPQVSATNNRLIDYGFDNSGNTITDAANNTFIYDAENKQVQVNNTNGIVGQYSYDGDGKRVKKVVPSTGETTVFVYDAGGKMVAEYSTVLSSQLDAKVSYLTNDHLGSPRITTDAYGQVISRRDFMPFGEEIARANYGNDSVRQKFTGYERDRETDLDFAQARYYKAVLGRFSLADPYNIVLEAQFEKDRNKAKNMFKQYMLSTGRWNRYVYTLNNPNVHIDPTGLDIMVIENRGTDGNPVGHTAIAITGRGVYSMGNAERGDRGNDGKGNIVGGGVKDYVLREMDRRDSVLVIIKTTPEQDAAAAAKVEEIASSRPQLTSGSETSFAFGENCSTRVNEALDAAGIRKPQGADVNIPGTAGGRAMRYGNSPETITLAQNGNLSLATSAQFKQFERPVPSPREGAGSPASAGPARNSRTKNEEK